MARTGTYYAGKTARVSGLHPRRWLEENRSINGGITTRYLHPSFFRSHRSLLILVLVILGSLFVKPAYASTFVGYTTTQAGQQTCSSCGNCGACTADGNGAKCGIGSVIQSPLTGTLTSVALQTGASLPNQVEIATFPAGTTPSSTPGTTNGCGYSGQLFTCVSANDGQSFTVQDVEGLSGLTGQTYTTVALANPISVTQNQWIAIQYTITSGNPTFGILMRACSGSTGTGTGCGAIVASNVWDVCLDFGTASPAIGSTATSVGLTNGFCGALGMMVGASFTPSGTTTQTVTQCYGNCGSPAITLANTNSTHTINFNQSITLFYEFQSNLNGFIINVTTNIAKQYNNGIGVIEAIYTIPSCPLGATPFSTTCPGLLASGWNVVGNPGKGRLANGNYLIPVTNGQWVGISITATMSGLDLNDTNAGVPLFQTSGGACSCPPPPIISHTSLFNTPSKMSLLSC